MIAGCGGAGGGSTSLPGENPGLTAPADAAKANPATANAVAAKATPTPSPVPLDHPTADGDKYQLSGTILTTYQRPDATPDPEPTQTVLDDVTQTITVTNPATFDGDSTAVDYETVETDHQTAPVSQTFKETVNNYFSFKNTDTSGEFLNLGYTSTDDSGYAVTYLFAKGNGVADKLPEHAGISWKNSAGATIETTSTDNEHSKEVVGGNGSYTDQIYYQNVNAQGPTTHAEIHSNIDGSGLYTTPRLGTDLGSNYSYVVASPSAAGPSGTITETTTIPAAPESTATPEVESTTVPNWIPVGMIGKKLATETDVDNGPVTIPASPCPIPTKYGTTANELVQTKVRVDPMFGETENTTTTTYVIPNVGPACVIIADVENDYYDFSGQNGVGYFSGTPQQITTLAENLYLTSTQLKSATSSDAIVRGETARSFALRVTTAEAHVALARIKQRLKRLHAAYAGGSAK